MDKPRRGPLARRACDACRRRKIRCDVESPQCSNCRSLQLRCEYSTRRKRGPKPRLSSAALSPQSPGACSSTSRSSSQRLTQSAVQSAAQLVTQSVAQVAEHEQELQYAERNHHYVPGDRDVGESGDTPRPLQVHRALNAAMHELGLSLEQTANDCIDRFVQWSFPIVPYIHPATLKQHVQLLLPSAEHLFHTTTTEPPRAEMRAFTLVTGACAFECRRMGHGSSSHRVDALCIPFLAASRDMLSCFEDWDISHADSSSLAIRMAQSGAFHNLGQTGKSWHILGEALRLAMDMRLFDQASYANLDPLEAKLRRNLFACIYMADKSASILNSRPTGFHEICLDDVTVDLVQLEDDFPLLDTEDERFAPPFEQRLHQGIIYHTLRLWTVATDLHLYMKIFTRLRTSRLLGVDSGSTEGCVVSDTQIMHLYVTFSSILDTLPPWLRDPSSYDDSTATIPTSTTSPPPNPPPTTTATTTARTSPPPHHLPFWTQHANLTLTFHTLRLLLLRRARKMHCTPLLGLTDSPEILMLREVEIANDLTAALARIPDEALQANGEPLVEKLRCVGAALLEVTQRSCCPVIVARARGLLGVVLDVVARLHSRVSDEV
ncbi:hypothetical protein BJY00DRAFT_67797 [Aspergillus carlsbadensis]|nr:hypothetical protein BJY00DRAFT_67797 [Aspergillus carlsbadensis]